MIQKQTMVLNEQKISYFDEGSKDSPPVLLLHGVPESSMLWKHIIPEVVSTGFRAIAPDLPGFGQSDQFKTKSTWENYLIFINNFMETLDLDEIHLIVHDWGGIIGLRWACDHPEKVSSLVISDTSLDPEYKWHPIARKWRTPGEGERIMEKTGNKTLWMKNMKNEVPGIDEDVLEDFYCVYQTEQSRNVILDLYRSANQKLVEPYLNLSKIKTCVTILWGEKDPYVDYEFAYKTQEKQLSQANVYIIPNAGHFIHVEVPEKVKPIIGDHFRSIMC
ncbi:alpha/beta hydrolase [Salicibibacter cibarius]|uniref:Alpha/beta hydrolase n=1 Tax=Salicibibacter cibarius TaxID=2743000 RepID=A0A7T6Z3Y1_9BACI|nr:alpha/beta hydrolase [Salicibibacter cibarius]QQK76575.1 alpha/beta hydrolase [Salicibibacter cibarius]